MASLAKKSAARDPRIGLNREELWKMIGYAPHAGQLLVHNSKARHRILACGVRWGKSTCSSAEAVEALLKPNPGETIGWIVAPTYELSDRVFNPIVKTFHESKELKSLIIDYRRMDRILTIRNVGGGESTIRGKSATEAMSLLGEGLDFVIFDEAAQCKKEIWESYLMQRLMDKKGWALLISTPKGKGWFCDMFYRGKAGHPKKEPDYESWNAPTYQNPIISKEMIEFEQSRMSASAYAQEFLAQFTEGSGAVFSNIADISNGELEPPVQGASYVAGLDIAKVEDYTVHIIIRRDLPVPRVVAVDRYNKIDWSANAARVKALHEAYFRPRITVDSTANQSIFCENLQKVGVRAVPYSMTIGNKVALMDNLTIMCEQKRIELPRREVCPELVEEMENYQYEMNDSGVVRTNAPRGYHDDCVVALALAAWNLKRSKDPYIGII